LATVEQIPVKCVEIHGLTVPLSEEDILRPGSASSSQSIQVNGEKGIWVDTRETDGKQILELFNGTCVAVPEANTKVVDVPRPELGGCDAIWPLNWMEAPPFANQIVSALSARPWCVIQMFLSDDDKAAALERADAMNNWTVPKKDFESANMGYGNCTKWAAFDSFDDLDTDDENPLREADSTMTEIGKLLSDMSSETFGFNLWGRMATMVRRPADDDDLAEMRPDSSDDDKEDGTIYGHLNFIERRKFCVLYTMANAGGELSFFTEDGTETKIPLTPRKLIIFRHDKLGYAYQPTGDSLALQAWFLTEPWVLDSDVDRGVVEMPELMDEARVNVMAATAHYPGQCDNVLGDFSAALTASFDGFIKVPMTRWDHSIYYDQHEKGKAYCEHAAFIDQKLLESFDNAIFGISDSEAKYMAPSQRVVLTTGLETLLMSGYRKEGLVGQKIGTFLGDSSSDWTSTFSPEMPPSPWSFSGRSNAITCMRLNYCLGMKGPSAGFDTACSSSLVAVSNAHTCIRKTFDYTFKPRTVNAQLDEALAMGVNLIIDQHLFVGYCGAGMLAKLGRCFTFDKSAMGFARGEGCGAFHLVSSTMEGKGHPDDFLAVLVGTFINQDGRSATMTAPNGPAQRDATMASLEESGFAADAVNTCECHGTGTALGDPIEVSALRNAIGHLHESPLYFSSAKTNCGHQEANAGLAGLHKCVVMLTMCGAMSNNHLSSLNPHLDVYMFPAYFESELTDFDTNTGLCGVSSFGSGGTNARGDVWSPCRRGPHKIDKIHDSAEVHRKRSVYFQRIEDYGRPGPQDSDIVYIIGTWNAWTAKEPMKRTGDNTFTATITLGETLWEQFRLVLDDEMEESIHPTVSKASPDAPIVGPDLEGHGLNWHIDGRNDFPGTPFRVDFEWGFDWERGEYRKIEWKALDHMNALPDYKHIYSIVGTWTTWKFAPMDKNPDGTFTTAFRIGPSGQEEFQFVRDNDWTQVIHPATKKTFKQSVPIRGPDDLGQDKHWLQTGTPGEKVTVTLKLVDGEINVTVDSPTKGTKKWNSNEKEGWHDYYVAGTWTNWGLSLMPPAKKEGKGFYKTRVTIGQDGREYFKIVMDRDWEQSIYPDTPDSGPTQGPAMLGPDAMGHGLNWSITGEEGQEFEVILNMSSRSVSWNLIA